MFCWILVFHVRDMLSSRCGEDFQPLVESTVVESAVLFYLPEILGGDSPTINIAIIRR